VQAPLAAASDGRRAAYRAGKITITESMSIPWVMRNHAHDRAEQIVFERKSSINTWVPVTWRQFYAEVRALARGLLALAVGVDATPASGRCACASPPTGPSDPSSSSTAGAYRR